MKTWAFVIALAFPIQAAFAWDGYDYNTGSYVEIGKGNTVREGETIEIYDHASGEYKDVDVQSVSRSGSHVDIDVVDDNGEPRTFEMDD